MTLKVSIKQGQSPQELLGFNMGVKTWNGGSGVDSNIGTAANWVGGVAPVSGSDSVIFTGAIRTTPTFSAGITLTGITFDSSASAFTIGGVSTLTLTGSIINNGTQEQKINCTISSTSVITVNCASGNITLGGVWLGTGAFNKTGPNTLTLKGNNTYSGAAVVTAGTLNVGGGTTIGTFGGTATVNNSGLIIFARTNTTTPGVAISGTGSVECNCTGGSGILVQNKLNTYSGTTTITAGSLNVGLANATSASSQFILANTSGATLNLNGFSTGIGSITGGGTTGGNLLLGAATLTIGNDNTSPAAYAGVIGGSSASGIIKKGTGTLTLTGTNTFAGTTSVQNGTLSIDTLKSVSGGSSSLGNPTTTAAGTISLGSTTTTGTLAYTGTVQSVNRVINLAGTTGGGTITQSGSGTLTLTSDMTATGSGAKTLTVDGSTSSVGVISGAIVNSASGATSITKSGTGQWSLSSATTSSTGSTTISAGTLLVATSGTLKTNSYSISAGATFALIESPPVMANIRRGWL
jgi:autotransporter-associated beta strand protein